ncbi:MAG: hypothetical protein KF905_09895 [Flavobacteriales bacterium]|nr:hypothetical protein [Flavobacteriales bacterium]
MKAMRRYLFPTAFIATTLTFTSCTQTRILVYDTNSDNVPHVDGQWISDNDTLLIAYSFWAEGGKLACVIFNKTDRQLFIDWKNSAFIVNDRKVELWRDAVDISSTSKGSSYSHQTSKSSSGNGFNWGWLTQSIGSQYSVAITTGTIVTNERITSIPPKSYIGLERFTFLTDLLYPVEGRSETILEDSYVKRGQQEKIKTSSFDRTSSPLRLRLFIAYAFTENMNAPLSINDSFWLSSISDMSFRHFEGNPIGRDPDGLVLYEKPRKNRKSFYLRYKK